MQPQLRPVGEKKEVTQESLLDDAVQSLLMGHVDAPNEFIAHLIKKVNEAKGTQTALRKEIMEIEERGKALFQKGVKLAGAIESYTDDIKEFLLKETEKTDGDEG